MSKVIFAVSLLSLVVALGISLREVQISVDALNYCLSDLEKQ